MPRPLLHFLRGLALCWVLLVILVAVFQRRLIYFPVRESEPHMFAAAEKLGLAPWRDAAGGVIGWRSATRTGPPPTNRLIVFHGNAGNALNRTYYVEGFEQLDGGRAWEVFLFEYPGYGARPGVPSQQSFDAAAHEAFQSLTASDARPVFLLGESLGSGPACALAAREPQRISGVCLVTPFRRMVDVAAHHYPWLPVRWILRDRWDNAAALAGFPGRLAVRLAGEDEVIPTVHGSRLCNDFTGPKRLWTEAGARHNDLNYAASSTFWLEASSFLLTSSGQ